jgi:hypothetical protein
MNPTKLQTDVQSFLEGRVPKDWFVEAPAIEIDHEEILLLGAIDTATSPQEFRERTREGRIAIASELEALYRRKVSWGVRRDGQTTIFTSLGLPVMTRLRLRERAVLDTLVDAGVARSRSDALAWCVKLVARHQGEWLAELREALVGVEHVRAEGPTLA